LPVLWSPVPRRRRAGGGGQQRCPGRRGTCSVLLLCGLPAGRAWGQGLAVAVVPGRWALDPAAGW